jgi:hypothetical protein
MDLKPGYKQTEVGVIPEGWETRRLGDLLQTSRSVRYGIVQPGKFDASGCFMLRSQDYSKGWAGPDGMHKVSAELENQYRNARIRFNDLVITVVGAGIGQVVVVPDWLDGAILSRSTARIAVDEEQAARSFVRAFLEGPLGKRQILDCQKEGAQPVVSCLDLARFFVASPPLSEQRAIATALSDVDALLGALERLIAKKRDLKQAAMQQLLTGQTRLPGFEVETGTQQTELGMLPKDWALKKIQNVCRLINGRGFKPHEWQTSGLPIIRIQNLNGSEEFNYYSGQYDSKILVEHAQLLFAWSGSRGTSFGPHVWRGGKALLNYHTWKVVINESCVDPGFLVHAFRQ